MEATIRAILDEVGGLVRPAGSLSTRDDLFVAGLTSFATVGVMLAIEDEFDVAFPDSLLVRSTFVSIDALMAAITSVKGEAHAA
ncbi:acyl carrier protein [Sphingomonas sp. CLY1604]|uniref:acyl carrier protein n=1 Tax=Sphingomonas sp. CLY1604 TaxID=3457786 RepID=UPI003FD8851F